MDLQEFKKQNVCQQLEISSDKFSRIIAFVDFANVDHWFDEDLYNLEGQVLSNNQKIAITLNKYEELSYQEVANIMGLSLSAVTALINRGKVNLQKKIRNFYKKSENTPKEN